MLETVSPWVMGCLVVTILGSWLLLIGLRRVTGSTLIAPWGWSLLGLWSVAAVEIYRVINPANLSDGFMAIQFAASLTTLLPAMALLGAQRPHDRIWQFVVVTLWIILILPAAKSSLLEPGSIFQVHPAWGWFFWVLISVGLFNRIGTRYWFAALLVAGGQCLLLAGQLPCLGQEFGVAGTLIALSCFVLAILVVHYQVRSDRLKLGRGFDRVWFDFRDLYGVLWGLRIAERINALARRHGWDLQLHWQGLAREQSDPPSANLSPDVEAVLHQNMKNLLRRFVTREWIESRFSDRENFLSGELGE